MFNRIHPDQMEVNIFRGFLTAVQQKLGKEVTLFGIDVIWLEDSAGVIIRYPSRITGREIIEVLSNLTADPAFERVSYFVGDRTDVTDMLVSSEEVREIAELNLKARERNPKHFVVLISPTNLSLAYPACMPVTSITKISSLCAETGPARLWLCEKGCQLPDQY